MGQEVVMTAIVRLVMLALWIVAFGLAGGVL